MSVHGQTAIVRATNLRGTSRCVQTLQRLIASVFLWSVCLAQVSGSVSANDTEAAFGAGGLVFQKSTDVALLSEELFVSLDQIVVKYRFRNDTLDDVSTIVAFPLPAIRYDPTDPDNEYGFSFARFHGFTTTVDGTRIQARVEEKAMLSGRDATLTLNRLGMPIDPWVASKAITQSPETTKAKLKNPSLIDDRGNPRWKLVRTYYWTQRFPAGREVSIEHRYKPMVGRSVATGLDVLADPKSQSAFYKRFCVDKIFLRAVRKRARVQQTPARSFVEGWSESWVEYILTTGANWSGPIRKFRLVVDKGRKENLVSFCGEGVRKIGPTLFEVTMTHFVPKKDLFLLVLTPRQSIDMSAASTKGLTDMSCDDLWIHRNRIYKAAGYCFKESRAVSYFGNSGCSIDDAAKVRLSRADQALVRRIRSLEEDKRCRR